MGDPAKYMSVEYNTAAHQNDVIDKFKTYLLAEGVASQGELDAVEAAVEAHGEGVSVRAGRAAAGSGGRAEVQLCLRQ